MIDSPPLLTVADDSQRLRRTRAIDDKSRVVRIGHYSNDGENAFVFVCHSGGKWRLRKKAIPIADLHPLLDDRSPLPILAEAVSESMTGLRHIPACKPRGRRRSKVRKAAG